ncbi:MAG: YncE family protein [Bacteroidales bacterium]
MKTMIYFTIGTLMLVFLVSCEKSNMQHHPNEKPASLTPEELKSVDYFDAGKMEQEENLKKGHNPKVLVANRGSGTVSVINTGTDAVDQTVMLPDNAEPMYVIRQPFSDRVFVGDRANNRLVVLNDNDYSVETTVDVGQGVFHMWSDYFGHQLWVVNDVDKTLSVINTHSLETLATVPIPADLAALNGFPHDVMVSPAGFLAYVTILGVDGDKDYVVQYYTPTFTEIGRAAVGKDAHLSLQFFDDHLFVPCQNANAVYVIDRFSMDIAKTIDVPGAHGAGMPVFGGKFYTTNISGGGTDGIYVIDIHTQDVIGTVNTPFPVPHNLSVKFNGRKKMYVTHSGGTADQVSVYKIIGNNGIPLHIKDITVGLNPFGISPMY